VGDAYSTQRRHVLVAQREVCLVVEAKESDVALIVNDRVSVSLTHADARTLGVQLLLAAHEAREAAEG